MQQPSVENNKSNKILVIFLGLLELLLFIIYGTLVDPTSSIVGGFFEWLTLMTVAFCLGYLYVNHQDRPFFGNVVGNWFIMWLISFQLYFLFVYMWLTIKVGQGINPIFSAGVIRSTNLPLLMLTISYVSLKGFLRLPEVITVSIIGIFAMSCNQYVVHVSLEGYDSTGLTVFLFGSIYGIMIRLIGVPSRSYSVHNKFIQMNRTQAMITLIFTLFFFPVLAAETDGISSLATGNTFMCMVCALIASLILHLAMGWKVYYQTLVYVSVSSAMIILITPGLIQNLAAPAVVGAIVGCCYTFSRDLMPKVQAAFKIPDPGMTIELFVIPTVIGCILSAIFIACYNIPGYNKLKNFPFANILQNPLQVGGMQLSVLIVNCLLAIGFGGLAGIILKYASPMNELEEKNLLFSEKQPGNMMMQGQSAEPLLSNQGAVGSGKEGDVAQVPEARNKSMARDVAPPPPAPPAQPFEGV